MFVTALLVVTLLAAQSVDGQSDNPVFDGAFEDFLQNNGYRGGAVAAMKDGSLIYAKGYGLDRAGHEVTAGSHFHLSSVAKSLTAVAVLKLVQSQSLALHDRVFGRDGILHKIVPWGGDHTSLDPRFDRMTVDHLLRHTAGWDDKEGPLYDPLINQFYRQRGDKVPDIAREMGETSPLGPETLISYMMSQPLIFTPGTRMSYSNIGYLVLGRVVEAASRLDYRDYIKRHILDTCGMWNTRLDLSAGHDTMTGVFGEKSLYEAIDTVTVDSALGWYSNVFDLMRFTRCVFETNTVLDDRHLKLLLARPTQQNETSWHCAGFQTSDKNVVWQDGDPHADDLIVYHDLNQRRKMGSREKVDLPDSWVVALYDQNVHHIRHHSRDLMALLATDPWTDDRENVFLYDISEIHKHPVWAETVRQRHQPEVTVHYSLDEHRLTPYVSALQAEGFDLHWFTSYTSGHGHTFFLVVGKRVAHLYSEQHNDFVFEHGMSHRSLLKKKLQLEGLGYNMTKLHSYKSRSHEPHSTSFAALFSRDAFHSDTQMKYGTSHLPEPYRKLVQMYLEQEFYPISQTVVYRNKDEEFSFIFIKQLRKDRTNFRHYYDLTVKQLAKLTVENAEGHDDLRLAYFNSYDVAGRFRFAAVFTNGTRAKGLLKVDQPEHRATEVTISNLVSGLLPVYVAPYLNQQKQLRLAIYYEEE